MTLAELEVALGQDVAGCYADPLRFVRQMYPWPINGEVGPDAWQAEVLTEIGRAVQARGFDGVHAVEPIRTAISSGHGVGKSALFAWIVDWLMSTRPHCVGTITANTNEQLAKKTWAAIQMWTQRCLTGHWFEINSQIMCVPKHRSSWFCAPQSCAEENSEAFAGQHAKSSTSFYLFDEASAVPKKIYEVAEGGLTDGEPMIIIAGNPTRNTGAFHEAVFGSRRGRWTSHIIDSRTCKLPNKALIAEWAEDYGEDSDFFRVRVRGLPPAQSELQFIGLDLVRSAQIRQVETLSDEPLIAGVDVSGGGAAWTTCWFRRGLDARSIPPIRISGTASKDRQYVVSRLAEALRQHQPAAMFVDSAFGAAVVERLNQLGFRQVYEVSFGGPSPDAHQENQRAYQWAALKEWLKRGAIPTHDERLAMDLQGPGFHLNKKNKLVLEAKDSMQKRGVASPDDGDGLSLTFAQPVMAPRGQRAGEGWQGIGVEQWAG